ncbi:MAG TPA: zinc ribbon domain-containing protein [Longimicrobium sp.]|nr:zinc ribbon domain-containing protein [Longimicrobium sp.]
MDALDRLYRRVSNAMLREPGRGFTVGDLYQELVPYRLIRAELGFGELAEYEHALLRLLSGEREYLELDRADVADEFRRELQAPNPILGIYRDYADIGVAPNPFAPVPNADAAAPPVVVAPPPGEEYGDLTLIVPEPEPEPPPRPRARPCPGCRAALPIDLDARYCPFCGKPLAPVPCAECSAVLEPEWAFCATCGHPRGGRLPAPKPEQRLR